MNRYDVYLVHASEDSPVVEPLASTLRSRGLRVWFNSFSVGRSIRQQMEEALQRTDFAVVVLSPTFFEKRWAVQEVEAVFALESSDGRDRILPVWFGVGAAEVRASSPMLSMRSAAVLESDSTNLSDVADQLVAAVVELSIGKSPGSYLRYQILTGIRWVTGPELFSESFELYDSTFPEEFAFVDLRHYGDDLSNLAQPDATVAPLIDVVRAASLYTGRRVLVIGRQIADSMHVLDRRLTGVQMASGIGGWDTETDLVSHCFQLTSVAFTANEICQNHCLGPYNHRTPGWAPAAPADNALCWISGVVLAAGSAPTIRNVNGQLVVLAGGHGVSPLVAIKSPRV